MFAINTGSWYQLILRRRLQPGSIPYPAIEWFTVTSDIKNISMVLGVENLAVAPKLRLSVENIVENIRNIIFSVENLANETHSVLSVTNTENLARMVLSVESL